ncbi:hypothetical protein KP509_23G051800 [Ceratopteris richardii]|uniref:Uncharacterized protein n=1 Tax=Ceratopteris richardii TaxID=49495 RepID=A0A8T2S2T5_CERRI|nr:hypothetical protein KP509_23G051800 [Ceratopteris richardii]
MRRVFPAQIDGGTRANVYFEFNFHDGVMVDCKEVNNSDWRCPFQVHPNASSKVWDSCGLSDSYYQRDFSSGSELRDSNAPTMEKRYDCKKDSPVSPNSRVHGAELSSALTSLNLSSLGSTSPVSNKGPSSKKRVHFLNGENNGDWIQKSDSLGELEHCAGCTASCKSSAAMENSQPPGRYAVEPHLPSKCLNRSNGSPKFGQSYRPGDHANSHVSLSTGHLDWLWCEDADGPEIPVTMHNGPKKLAASQFGFHNRVRNNGSVERSKEHHHSLPVVEETCSPDESTSMACGRHSLKDLGGDCGKQVAGGWSAFPGGDSARCSSMSLTDLVETSPGKCPRENTRRERCTLASHLQLAGSSLANQFITKEVETDCFWPFSPVHSSLSTSSASKRDSAATKSDPKNLSITHPTPSGNIHGILHCTLREGLPNYTFLLDEYDEAVTAKIWMEDVLIGEQHGVWRYSFYSLKGDGKKKGRSGWKHWRKNEKLASELVGTMRVSSVLCSEPALNGSENISVESEFVLLGSRSQDPLAHSHMDRFSHASLSSSETAKAANHVMINTLSSPSQSRASSSDGAHSDSSSPGAISAWYVSQSLIPTSLGSPDVSLDGNQKGRKWSFHSGISGIRTKAKKKGQQPASMCAKEPAVEPTCNIPQPQSELAAMIIRVPLELQEGIKGQIPASMSDAEQHMGSPTVECTTGEFQNGLPRITSQNEVHARVEEGHVMKHQSHDPHRQVCITVILPSGNHGRPLSDMRGPSPLIKRWKEGGKCDCKGWDLGCGLLVLSNKQAMSERPEKALTRTKDFQVHNKPLTLYRQVCLIVMSDWLFIEHHVTYVDGLIVIMNVH